jgi:AraC-like DNA-binding protein
MDLTSHVFRFSTEGLPAEQQLRRWTEALDCFQRGRRIMSRLSDGPLRVQMVVRKLGRAGPERDAHAGLSLMRMTAGVHGTEQWTPGPGDDDDVALVIHEAGCRIVSQLGREARAEPLGAILVSYADPQTVVLPGPSRFVSVSVPRKLMMALTPSLEDTFVRPLPPGAGILHLLLRYIDILEDEQALSAPELQRAVTTHIHDLVAMAIGATREAAEIAEGRGLRAARMRAIKTDITEKLANGNGHVSATSLALRQGVSPRYIQKLFENEGTTLSRFVLGRRLAQVHRMLTDRRNDHRTISSIAYAVGFGDLSTFNREFRRQFGETPSDVRAAARREHAAPAQGIIASTQGG